MPEWNGPYLRRSSVPKRISGGANAHYPTKQPRKVGLIAQRERDLREWRACSQSVAGPDQYKALAKPSKTTGMRKICGTKCPIRAAPMDGPPNSRLLQNDHRNAAIAAIAAGVYRSSANSAVSSGHE